MSQNNTSQKIKRLENSAGKVCANTLNATEIIYLIRNHRSLVEEKVNFLKYDVRNFSWAVDRITGVEFMFFVNHIPHIDKLVKELDDSRYLKVLQYDIERFFNKTRWEEISKYVKRHHLPPMTVVNMIKNGMIDLIRPYMTVGILISIAHATDIPEDIISEKKLPAEFWIEYINRNNAHINLLIKYISGVKSGTDLRKIIYNFPEIIKYISPDIIERSPFTAKQWVLMITSMVQDEMYIKDIWDSVDNSVKEYLKVSTICNAFSEPNGPSKRLTNAIARTLK